MITRFSSSLERARGNSVFGTYRTFASSSREQAQERKPLDLSSRVWSAATGLLGISLSLDRYSPSSMDAAEKCRSLRYWTPGWGCIHGTTITYDPEIAKARKYIPTAMYLCPANVRGEKRRLESWREKGVPVAWFLCWCQAAPKKLEFVSPKRKIAWPLAVAAGYFEKGLMKALLSFSAD